MIYEHQSVYDDVLFSEHTALFNITALEVKVKRLIEFALFLSYRDRVESCCPVDLVLI